jgi:hypothetical protein
LTAKPADRLEKDQKLLPNMHIAIYMNKKHIPADCRLLVTMKLEVRTSEKNTCE